MNIIAYSKAFCQGKLLISRCFLLLDLKDSPENWGERLGCADYYYFHKGITFFPNVVCVFWRGFTVSFGIFQ